MADITQRPYRRSVPLTMDKVQAVQRYIEAELSKLEMTMRNLEDSQTYVMSTLPARPLKGMVRYFNEGVVSEGSSEGFYGYTGLEWKMFTLT